MSMVTVVIGLQWGDEGKGKIVDFLAKKADVVVRCQGGPNADHTVVVNSSKFVFRHIPAGCLHSHTLCVIGDGCYIDPEVLNMEINGLKKSGFDFKCRLFISKNAHLIMPYHKKIDRVYHRTKATTAWGVGPCAESKYGRRGITMRDIISASEFRKKLSLNPAISEIDFQRYLRIGKEINKYLSDTTELLNHLIDDRKKIIIESAQGALLDVAYGTYPFVTSSHTTVGGVCIGSGIAPTKINRVIGVIKAYPTRLGYGPFPTEITNNVSEKIRMRGNEYLSTMKGKRRRIGWFDAPLLKYMMKINDVSELALTKLDVFDRLERLKICLAYKDSKGGLHHSVSAASTGYFTPVYEELKGWKKPLRGIRSSKNFPPNAARYINKISQLLGKKISLVSTGPERNDIVRL